MSNYEPKNGQITVWKNDKYVDGGKYHYANGRGTNFDGKPVEVTIWIPKSDKMANRAFNITIKEVIPTNDKPVQSAGNEISVNNVNGDDLPF